MMLVRALRAFRLATSAAALLCWGMVWRRLDHVHAEPVPSAGLSLLGVLLVAALLADVLRADPVRTGRGAEALRDPVTRLALGVGALLDTTLLVPGREVPLHAPGMAWGFLMVGLIALGIPQDVAAAFDPRLH